MEYGLLGVFSAGILTMFTPCVLPLIPVYLSIIMGSTFDEESPKLSHRLNLLFNTLIFALGFTMVFTIYGLSATALGSFIVKNKIYFSLFGGLLVVLMGLKIFGWLNIEILEREFKLKHRTDNHIGPLNSFLMGMLFSFGWTPCVGPVLGSVLTYAATSASSSLEGGFYLAVYSFGLALPLIVFSILAGSVRNSIRWLSQHLNKFRTVSGILMIVAGIYLMLGSVKPPMPAGDMSPVVSEIGSNDKSEIFPPLGEKTDRPRLVEFVSKNCNICRQMIPTMNALARECGMKNVEIVKVDVTESENKSLISTYNIRGVPTFLFFGKDGFEFSRQIGFQTPQALMQSLASLVGDKCSGVAMMPKIDIPEIKETSNIQSDSHNATCDSTGSTNSAGVCKIK